MDTKNCLKLLQRKSGEELMVKKWSKLPSAMAIQEFAFALQGLLVLEEASVLQSAVEKGADCCCRKAVPGCPRSKGSRRDPASSPQGGPQLHCIQAQKNHPPHPQGSQTAQKKL